MEVLKESTFWVAVITTAWAIGQFVAVRKTNRVDKAREKRQGNATIVANSAAPVLSPGTVDTVRLSQSVNGVGDEWQARGQTVVMVEGGDLITVSEIVARHLDLLQAVAQGRADPEETKVKAFDAFREVSRILTTYQNPIARHRTSMRMWIAGLAATYLAAIHTPINGWLLLTRAIESDFPVLAFALATPANVNYRGNRDQTALHYAAGKCFPALTGWLRLIGGDVAAGASSETGGTYTPAEAVDMQRETRSDACVRTRRALGG